MGVAAPAWADDAQPQPTEVAAVNVIGDIHDVPGVQPERTLDEDAIGAYGLNTIDELLAQVGAENGDLDEAPVVLVNGQREEDVGDIRDYPAEAVRRLQVLPRGSGARYGASATAHVYNVVLKRSFTTNVGELSRQASTDGGWTASEAALTFTRIQQPNRINASLRVRREAGLLESERGLLQPPPAAPFDMRGNVVADPRAGGTEIDPALSALAGRVLSVAPSPPGSPTGLSDFLNPMPNVTDLGRYRTLRPATDEAELNISANQRLSDHLNAALTGRVSRRDNAYVYGLPSGVLIVPADTPGSPFTQAVGLAIYGRTPLKNRYRFTNGLLNGTLTWTPGPSWQASLSARYRRAETRSTTTRQSSGASGARVISDPAVNPFASDLSTFLTLTREKALFRTSEAAISATTRGVLLDLPAGPLRLSANAGWSKLRARTQTSQVRDVDRTRRELDATVAAEVPIASRDRHVLAWLGDLSANLEYGTADPSDAGAYHRTNLGVSWAPTTRLRLQANRSKEGKAPLLDYLNGPSIVTEGVRYFDPLTGQTVDVTSVSGGNPDLGRETVTTNRVGVTLTAVKRLNLNLKAEYQAQTDRGAATGLPVASLEVMSAFPERFVRDAGGRLVLVDFRPIGLARQRHEQVNWGFTLDAPLSALRPPAPGVAFKPQARLQASASLTHVLTNEVVIRAGLPTIDLLEGGALGFAGGRPRDQVTASVGLSQGGLGTQLTGQWRSGSRLTTGASGHQQQLRFSALGTLNLRAYADLKSVWSDSPWAKGTRLTLSVANIANSRQRVRDETGATPLRYQPAYLDPLGRTVELELRRTF